MSRTLKIFLISFVSITVLILSLYYFNKLSPIYQLNQATAKFIDYQETPLNLPSLKAQDCGICHIEIYQEWKQSLHSEAFHDPYFQAYLKKDNNDPTCLVCHTPLANQAENILLSHDNYQSVQIVANHRFDRKLQSEGVTCAACHVRNGIVYGPYLVESMDAPHPVAYDPKFTNKSICLQCHEVPAKKFSLLKEGICSTGAESQVGPWAKAGYICQNCHMPEVNRPLMAGFPSRPGRKHLWPGGFSKQQLQKVFKFQAKYENNRLYLTITNAGAGHKVPTGDSDRFIRLKFYWQTPNQPEHLLDEVEFKRQMLWQPIIMEWSDNRLEPGQSLNLAWPLLSTNGKLVVQGTYHVMSEWSKNRLERKFGLSRSLDNKWAINRPFIIDREIPIVNLP